MRWFFAFTNRPFSARHSGDDARASQPREPEQEAGECGHHLQEDARQLQVEVLSHLLACSGNSRTMHDGDMSASKLR